jgi:hypothetical protein
VCVSLVVMTRLAEWLRLNALLTTKVENCRICLVNTRLSLPNGTDGMKINFVLERINKKQSSEISSSGINMSGI